MRLKRARRLDLTGVEGFCPCRQEMKISGGTSQTDICTPLYTICTPNQAVYHRTLHARKMALHEGVPRKRGVFFCAVEARKGERNVQFLYKSIISLPPFETVKSLREFWCGGVGDTFCSQVFLKMRERSERHFLKKLVSKGKPPTCVWRALVMKYRCHI